jgi:hypothetical protein
MTTGTALSIRRMLALLLAAHAAEECDQPGVHLEFGGTERDLAEAYYDSAHDSGSHYIVFTGSFVPHVNGTHTFTVTCTTYFTSVLMPAVAHLEWDELPVKSGRDTWSWTTELRQDFRYSYKCTTDDNFYYATLEMQATIPSGATFRVNTDYSDTCTVIGCRNVSFTRQNNCGPPGAVVAVPRPPRGAQPPPANGAQRPRGLAAEVAGALAAVAGAAVGAAAVVAVRRRRAAPPEGTAAALLGENAPMGEIGGAQ